MKSLLERLAKHRPSLVQISRGDETRYQILLAAAGLFRTRGYSGTTLRNIATLSKIKAGSIYYHFSSKEQILKEILDIGMSDVREASEARLNALPADATAKEKVLAAMMGHLEGLLRHGAEFSSASFRVYGHLPAHLKKANHQARHEYGQFFDELLLGAIQSGELRSDLTPSIVRLVVVGALNWVTEWFDPKRDNLDEVVRQVLTMILGGIFERPGLEEVPKQRKARVPAVQGGVRSVRYGQSRLPT
jgi:AcrR family transcriptional regulator